MTATKQAAHGTLFKIDPDGNSSFDTLTLTTDVTPPPRVREEIEGRELADDFEVPILGIEMASKFDVVQFWHPGDTNHELIDTAFDAKTDFAAQIVTSHNTPVTDEFNVKVVGLTPETLTPGGTYKRTVSFLRTSDITRT